ncbi:hypothetical protein [Parapedobacter lycopersici]|uniref:hypothetical protein n=1 Tax=Parapedobacter lycopersici TaxID=1864939 RepID=UPI0033403D65
MTQEKDYTRDLTAIRSMMERTSKFLSLSGWAGVMAGIYALAGVYIAYQYLGVRPDQLTYAATAPETWSITGTRLIALALTVLVLAIGTAVYLSYKKAGKRSEKLWNGTSRRLVLNMAVPLVTGGVLILILIAKGLTGLIVPFTLIFYGLALYSAGQFTYGAVRVLGLIEIGLGLISAYFVGLGLYCWAVGFGLFHIIYGIYIHYRYEQ